MEGKFRVKGDVILLEGWFGEKGLAEVRSIHSRKWDSKNKCNRFSQSAVCELVVFGAAHNLDLSPLLPVLEKGLQQEFPLSADRQVVERAAFLADLPIPERLVLRDKQVQVWMEKLSIVVNVPFSPVVARMLRKIPTSRWDKRRRMWRFKPAVAKDVLELADRFGWVVDDSVVADEPLRFAPTSFTFRPGFGLELLPFQEQSVSFAESCFTAHRGMLIADEMGLGKTIQALAIAHHLQLFPTVVVCPAVMKYRWAQEVERALGHEVEILSGSKPYPVPYRKVLIINWDVLSDWESYLAEYDPMMVVFDESHYAKNRRAIRTRAAIALARSVHQAKGFTLCLSGTPVLNNVKELWPQLRLLGERLGAYTDWVGIEDRLGETLRATVMVRRTKQQVLSDLPKSRWVHVPVECDSEILAKYRLAEDSLRQYFITEYGSVEGAVRAARAKPAEALVRFGELRKLAAAGKRSAALAFVEDILAQGEKVVVFCWHNETVESLAGLDGVVTVTGSVSGPERAERVLKFQTDDKVRVFVGTIRAAGVGVTLTAASNVVFVEQGWNAAEMEQALARCHRIGQKSSVTGWVLLAPNTIDVLLQEMIDKKRVLANKVVGSDATANVAEMLVSEFLGGRNVCS